MATDFTALDAALTGAGVDEDQLPMWRMLYLLENNSRMAANGVPARSMLTNPTKFIAYLHQQGILEE